MTRPVLITAVILFFAYIFLFHLASNGYGYPGYYGYHRGGSFWYWNSGTNYYYDQSSRSGSLGGTGRIGGGPGSGK